MIATMTSQGQITIPRAIRDQLGLNAGTQVEFEVSNDRLVGHKVATLREADLWMAHSDVRAAARLLGPPRSGYHDSCRGGGTASTTVAAGAVNCWPLRVILIAANDKPLPLRLGERSDARVCTTRSLRRKFAKRS